MNENIKQLAIECYKPYGNFDTEKFAEMIVFECIKLAVFKGDATTGKAIKEHFGVDNE
jgi:hypothetical protein